MIVPTLKRRAEFLRIRGGRRWACGTFVLESKPRVDAEGDVPIGPRVGYTVTKRMGNAVTRNRIKRRLRAAMAEMTANELHNDCDYVLIARNGALKRAFSDLTKDLRTGLRKIHQQKQHRQIADLT